MKKIVIFLLILNLNFSFSQELIIGEETVDPGIAFIFEGAVKDHVMPNGMHLKESQTNIHIEARVNWDSKIFPMGHLLVDLLHICILLQKLQTKKQD